MSSNMVEGFRYKTESGDMGAVSVTSTVIYIPSRNLSINSDGRLFKSARKLHPIAADKANREYFKKMIRERLPFNREEHRRAMEEADIAASECIQVPLEIVEQLETELQLLEEIKKTRAETKQRISEVSKKLFSE